MLTKKGKGGATPLDSYLVLARRGNRRALDMLEGPPFPEALDYLYRWHCELLGRSGVGMDGFAPLTYEAVAHWQSLMERVAEPHEVEALMVLDTIARHPEAWTDQDGR